MAAPANYFVKTASFKGTSITGLKNYDIGEDGSPTDVATDGSATITMTFLNNLGMTVGLASTDASLPSAAAFRVGAAGALILVLQKRAEGKGPAAASDKTLTFANAVLVSVTEGVPHEGESTIQLSFRCSDPAGSTPVVWS